MASRRKRSRKKESPVEILLGAPWQISVGIGVVVLVGIKWVLPAVAAGNMFLKPISIAASGAAWLFSGVFFLIGVIAFIKGKVSNGRLRIIEPAIGGTSVDRIGRSEPSNLKQDNNIVRFPGTSNAPANQQGERKEPDIAEATPKPTEWSLELIRDLEWKRFEDVCQQFYEKKGIRSETTALGPDGGIDIRLYQDNSGLPTSIVQCKAWSERQVGVKPVRELLGVMTHEKIGKAFFMTSGSYTDEAKVIAQANRITLMDGAMLLMMIQRLPSDERQSLLSFALEGDYKTPTCPSCGTKMHAIEGKGDRPDFWGCKSYPRCRQKLGKRRALSA